MTRSTNALCLLAAMAAAACGSSATTVTSPTSLTRCSVTVAGPSNLPAQGGNGTINVSAARECSWTASTEGQWLSIRSGTSGQGEGAVEFAAAPNPDPASRRGAIVLNDQRVEVTQAPAECVITLAENSSSFPQAGGSGRVDVRASSGLCTWTAESDSNWIVLRSDPNGKGTASVPFDVAATAGPPRSGTIKIAGQRFSVTQAEGCGYSISPDSHTAGAAGGAGTIALTTAPGCPWTAGSNVSWLTLSETAGSGPAALSFSVASTTGAARSGMAVIGGQTFSVIQAPGCTYIVNPMSQAVDAAGGVVSVNVASAAGCQWSAASSTSWIRLNGTAASAGNGSVSFAVDANTGGARSEAVSVAGKAVTITQSAGSAPQTCTLTISPETASIPAAGGSGRIAVSVAAGCPWSATASEPWLQISPPASGNGPGEVSFTAGPLSSGSRTGALTIGGRTFTVNQACSFTLSATGQTVPSAGGTGTVGVSTDAVCSWTAVSSAPWLTITGGATGTGNGTVSFGAAAEPSGSPRTGTLSIAGQFFTVTQSAGCAFSITPEQQNVDAAGATVNVAVTTAPGCAWAMSTTTPWITLKSAGQESGNGTVQVTVGANSGAARAGSATIAGRTFTVNQAERSCSYTVQPLDVRVNQKERPLKIDVTSAPGCTWTAVSNVAWMRVVFGANGSGQGDVWIYVTENKGGERTGTLTIAGQTVTVTQREEK